MEQLTQQEKNTHTMLAENFFDVEKTFAELKNEIKEKLKFENVSPERAAKMAEQESTDQARERFKELGMKLMSIGKSLKKKS